MLQQSTILIAEDDSNLGFIIKDNLERSGFKVLLESDGVGAMQAFNACKPDLCILDVMLPKKDGFALAAGIRKIDEQVPILFLTAKAMHEDKVKGFKAGGDDYLTKPFMMEELILRINSLLKRLGKSTTNQESLAAYPIGRYVFDHKNLLLRIDANERTLTKKEADLLKLLCQHQGQILERQVALNIVWGNDDYFLGRSMDVFITRLRKYLKDDPRIEIQGVHGVGFRLVVNS